jgi:alanine dehydrogenase
MLMVVLLSEADVTSLISMADGVRLVEQALQQHAAGASLVMPRVSADLPGGGGAFRVMSAVLPEAGFFGLKTLTGYPGRRKANETYFALLLFGCESGALRAVVAASRLTGIRTGAATGVAAKYMSRPDSRVLGMFGAGVQARYQVAALAHVRTLEEVRIFDVDARKAEAFARDVHIDLNIPARAVANPREAVDGCDLVVSVTVSKEPVFDGNWLEPGTHVSGVGSNSPGKCELDPTTFQRSRIVVDFKDQVLQEAGDLRAALKTGALDDRAIDAELGDIVSGKKPGRVNASEITLFKSVGMAIEDIATASFAYQRALEAGVGMRLDLDGTQQADAAARLADAGAPRTAVQI